MQILPANIKKDALHLFVEDDSTHEKDLDRHLNMPAVVGQRDDVGAGGVAPDLADLGKPVMHIVHLAPADEEPAPEEEGSTEAVEPEPDKFKYDFETRLAHDVLVQTKSRERDPRRGARASEEACRRRGSPHRRGARQARRRLDHW